LRLFLTSQRLLPDEDGGVMTFSVICPYCGHKIPTDIEWAYEDYTQVCPNCQGVFQVVDGNVVDGEDDD